MAIETVSVDSGTGIDVAVDEVGGANYQVLKIGLGADGALDNLVDSGQQTMANSLPVVLASDQPPIEVFDQDVATATGDMAQAVVEIGGGLSDVVFSVGGETSDGLVRTLPVAEAGGTAHTYTIPVSGVDGSGNAQALPIGQVAMEASVSVAIASDQAEVPVTLTSTTITGTVATAPTTSGGLSMFKSLDLDESEEEIKDTAGQVYWIYACNLTASRRYLKLYDADMDDVIVGTTVPDWTFPIPTNGDTNGVCLILNFPAGVQFANAITAAVTTGLAHADAGAPGGEPCRLHDWL